MVRVDRFRLHPRRLAAYWEKLGKAYYPPSGMPPLSMHVFMNRLIPVQSACHWPLLMYIQSKRHSMLLAV